MRPAVWHAGSIAVAAMVHLCATPALAQSGRVDCVVDVLERRDADFEQLQATLTTTVATLDPTLAGTARDAELAQLAMRRASTRRVHYLMKTRPDILDRTTSLSGLVNTEMSQEDIAALRADNPDYIALETARDAAIARTQDAPAMEQLRALVAEAARDPDGLGAVLAEFAAESAALNATFMACLK